MLVAVLPFMIIASRHRARHQREVIKAVMTRAPMMEPPELYDLVEALENEHGSHEMQPLRGLLRERL